MPAVALSPIFNGYQGFTANGLPNAGGLINTYLAGTTTPAATYTDISGTTANTNPIQLGPDGRPPQEIWLAIGTGYRFILTDSLGLNPISYDNITGVGDTFLASLASSAGATLIGWIQNAAGAILRTVSDKFFDTVAISDFMTTAQKADSRSFSGSLDLSAAFQAAVDAVVAAGGGTIKFPPGAYRNVTTTTKTTTKSIRLKGSGLGVTQIIKSGDSDCFAFTNTAAGGVVFTFEDMTITPVTNMTTGAAISLRDDNVLPSVRMKNLFIGAAGGGEFKRGVKLVNCTEPQFDGVVIYGLGTTNLVAYDITSTVPATVPKWFGCSVYNAQVGAAVSNTANPGIEGLQFYGCDFVGVSIGVSYLNTVAGYFPPQLTWVGGHINAALYNFNLSKVVQLLIHGSLQYNSGGSFINSDTAGDFNVCGNEFVSVGAGPTSGIALSASSATNMGRFADNYFVLGATIPAFSLTAANMQNLVIENNQSVGGGPMVNVTGTLATSVTIRNNIPLDTDDVFKTVVTTGTTPTLVVPLAGVRSDCQLILITALAGVGSASTMTGGYFGQQLSLNYGGANALTLVHSGAANGFNLKGSTNHVFASGGETLNFVFANGGFWTQV